MELPSDLLPDLSFDIVKAILAYVGCSSVLLLVNKVVVTLIPVPACVFVVQITAAVVFIFVCKALRLIQVDDFTVQKVKGYTPYTFLFVSAIYSNGKALSQSNAETVIVFRSTTPLFVSMLEYMVLGRELPNKQSGLALLGVLVGAIGYMMADSEFQMNGFIAYFWVSIYTLLICCEMTLGKALQKRVELETPVWGSVMFQNALGLAPMSMVAIFSGELKTIQSLSSESTSTIALLVLVGSCIIGIAIGWSTWNCRNRVSATSFTLLGVSCKVFTVLLNMLIWNKHATPIGVCWLFVCLVSSSFYRQAPLRDLKISPPDEKPRPTQLGNMSSEIAGNDPQEVEPLTQLEAKSQLEAAENDCEEGEILKV